MMAGIWERWGSGTEVQNTFSILTTGPNAEMAPLHNRMPLILPTEAAQKKWLGKLSEESLVEMMVPPADGLLDMYRVSERLNSTGVDDPTLHEEVADALRLF